MSIEAVTSRRIRRTWEPSEKHWNDDALETPWENIDPPLHKVTVFSLKNVFFFSHATAVQAAALKTLSIEGESGIIEAPTGSGKTLSFLIPMMERTIRWCESYVATHQRPPLTRNILGIILSPSRALAEQTYVVGKQLAARYPYNVQFILCDGTVGKSDAVLKRLQRSQRGAGFYLNTTPKDLKDLLEQMKHAEGVSSSATQQQASEELLAEQDEETRRRYLARREQKQARTEAESSSSPIKGGDRIEFFSSSSKRFTIVMDEADLLFNSPDMRQTVVDFIQDHCLPIERAASGKESAKRKRKRPHQPHAGLHSDFVFVGATVATSPRVQQYAHEVCKSYGTNLNLVSVGSPSDFLLQLQSKYAVCEAGDFLPTFIQMMNLHASKKHFVFFNSYRALLFAQRLFQNLCQGARPLLFISSIFTMYEGMAENARIEQYNAFLTHSAFKGGPEKTKKPPSDAEKKNQIFTGGWKRDGRTPMGSGAILLCTDVAAFGLDVRDVDYVYHFEPPSSVQAYVHRVGRVGRMGMRGCSVVLLPCLANAAAASNAKERKTTSDRFETVANTKKSTSELHSNRALLQQFGPRWEQYINDLAQHVSIQEYIVPPFAPISSTLRNVIHQDTKLQKLARAAAISMCETGGDEKVSWFTPKMCLRVLFLD